jgi:hypothetical protein
MSGRAPRAAGALLPVLAFAAFLVFGNGCYLLAGRPERLAAVDPSGRPVLAPGARP